MNEYDTAFNALLSINKSSFNPRFATNLTDWTFWRDYGTIRLDAGQRTGKATWVKSKSSSEDLVIDRLLKAPECFGTIVPSIHNIFSLEKTLFRYVFLCQASWCIEEKHHELFYKSLIPFLTKQSRIIFIG